jgi:predicted DNA-binding helix-hairpin-helix protein
MARIFMDYLRKRNIFGLFLSSGVPGTPDGGMQQLIDTVSILRRRHAFRGYVHLKILPGASDAAIEEAMRISTAVSLNIEVPGRDHFKKISSSKDYDRDIIRPLKLMSRLSAKGGAAQGVKCTTQFIVGASDESDADIIKDMDGLSKRLKFRRVYFSAYQPGLLGDPSIPGESRMELVSVRREPAAGAPPLPDGLPDASIRVSKLDENTARRQWPSRPGERPQAAMGRAHPENFPVNVNKATKNRAPENPPASDREARSRIIATRLQPGRLSDNRLLGLKGVALAQAKSYCNSEKSVSRPCRSPEAEERLSHKAPPLRSSTAFVWVVTASSTRQDFIQLARARIS